MPLRALRRRLVHLLRSFSFSAVGALSAPAWSRLGLVSDVSVIVDELRRATLRQRRRMTVTRHAAGKKPRQPSKGNSRSSPLLSFADDDDEDDDAATAAAAGASSDDYDDDEAAVVTAMEEAWVRYAYALRDHLLALCSGQPVSPWI